MGIVWYHLQLIPGSTRICYEAEESHGLKKMIESAEKT